MRRPRKTVSKLDEIHERTLVFFEDLSNARDKGTLTPTVTLSSETMAKRLNIAHKWDISGGAGLRELVNHGRSIDLPIGGNGKGYWKANNSAEMMVVVQDLKSRIAKMSQALQGAERCVNRMKQLEAFQSNQAAMLGEREREE